MNADQIDPWNADRDVLLSNGGREIGVTFLVLGVRDSAKSPLKYAVFQSQTGRSYRLRGVYDKETAEGLFRIRVE